MTHERTIDEPDFIEIKNFCSAEDDKPRDCEDKPRQGDNSVKNTFGKGLSPKYTKNA